MHFLPHGGDRSQLCPRFRWRHPRFRSPLLKKSRICSEWLLFVLYYLASFILLAGHRIRAPALVPSSLVNVLHVEQGSLNAAVDLQKSKSCELLSHLLSLIFSQPSLAVGRVLFFRPFVFCSNKVMFTGCSRPRWRLSAHCSVCNSDNNRGRRVVCSYLHAFAGDCVIFPTDVLICSFTSLTPIVLNAIAWTPRQAIFSLSQFIRIMMLLIKL